MECLKGDDIDRVMSKAGVNRAQAVNALLGSSVALKPLSQQRQALLEVLEDGNVEMVMATASVNAEQAIKALLDSSKNIADALTALDPHWRKRRALMEVLEDAAIEKALCRASVNREQAAQALLDSSIAGHKLPSQRNKLFAVLEDDNIDIVMENASVSKEKALQGLLDSSGDIIDALKMLDPAGWVLEHLPDDAMTAKKSRARQEEEARQARLEEAAQARAMAEANAQQNAASAQEAPKEAADSDAKPSRRKRVKAAVSDGHKTNGHTVASDPHRTNGHRASP